MTQNKKTDVRIIASDEVWMDGKAVAQLHSVAKLPEVNRAVGMPDMHASRSIPVGFAIVTKGLIYPHLIGNDIGCGMGLWRTDLKARQVKLDKWERKLTGLDLPWDGNRTAFLQRESALPTPLDSSLGTIGGGNHFTELHRVEEEVDAAACEELGVHKKLLYLLVHSGSRGLGEFVQKKYRETAFHGLKSDSPEAREYLLDHRHAVAWAKANRSLISHRFLACLGTVGERIVDEEHNSVERYTSASGDSWIHRKGASPSNRGPVVIPGSRGSFSYLVQPIGAQEPSAYSLPHGAGRKWSRSDCKDRLRKRYSLESLTRTELGSRVVCDNKSLLYQEAPQAYKDIEVIINGLQKAGLIKVVAKLRPLITYKMKNDRDRSSR